MHRIRRRQFLTTDPSTTRKQWCRAAALSGGYFHGSEAKRTPGRGLGDPGCAGCPHLSLAARRGMG